MYKRIYVAMHMRCMKKAVLFVIVLVLLMPGCINRRSREDKPESALLSFFDAYSARRFSKASEMTTSFQAAAVFKSLRLP